MWKNQERNWVIGAAAAAVLMVDVSGARADRYAGRCRTNSSYVAYEPSYYEAGVSIRYGAPSGYVSYGRAYAEPTYARTRVVREVPVVRYVRPVYRHHRRHHVRPHYRTYRHYKRAYHYRPSYRHRAFHYDSGHYRNHYRGHYRRGISYRSHSYRHRPHSSIRFGHRRSGRHRHHGGFSVRFGR